jgi:hypothetical protein
MAVKKITISLDAELVKGVRAAAAREGVAVSAWMAEAAAAELRHRRALEVERAFEAEFGPITDDQARAVDEQWPGSLLTPESSSRQTVEPSSSDPSGQRSVVSAAG